MIMLVGAAFADKPVEQRSQNKNPTSEQTVFVTGSLIPDGLTNPDH